MSEANFRVEPIRSRRYLDGAKDQTCVFEIPGICLGGPSVSCHLHDDIFGKSRKADDTSTADGCMACHDAMDGRSVVLSREDWLFYALRGLQRTIRRRIKQKLLLLHQDAPPPPKPAKSKADRKPSRPMQSGNRPIQSAPFPEQRRPFSQPSAPRVRDLRADIEPEQQ